eukprot:6284364-Amphidinium_carterae.3
MHTSLYIESTIPVVCIPAPLSHFHGEIPPTCYKMSNKAVHLPQNHRYVHTAVVKSQHSHCASLDRHCTFLHKVATSRPQLCHSLGSIEEYYKMDMSIIAWRHGVTLSVMPTLAPLRVTSPGAARTDHYVTIATEISNVQTQAPTLHPSCKHAACRSSHECKLHVHAPPMLNLRARTLAVGTR